MIYILRVSGLSKETGLISGSFFSSSSCFFCPTRLGTMPVSTNLWNNSFIFSGNVGAGAEGFSTGSASYDKPDDGAIADGRTDDNISNCKSEKLIIL